MTSILQEDKGLNKIFKACIDMNAIWRPTPSHDIGIDGQIEFLEPKKNISTGHIVAVQSKSGPSYFVNQDDDCVKYYPKDRHKRYWKRLKLPVILILHNPDDDLTIFARVKPQLDKDGPLLIPKNNTFSPSARDSLIIEIEKDYEDFINKSPFEIIEGFSRIKLVRAGHKEITGIDFILACTNRDQHFFELRMCRIVSLFELLSEESSISFASDDYDYILRNTLQLYAQRIVPDFLEEFDEMWYEFRMVPDISTPLTEVGVNFVEYLWENIDEYLNSANYKHLNFQNVVELAKYISDEAQSSSDWLDESDRLPETPR